MKPYYVFLAPLLLAACTAEMSDPVEDITESHGVTCTVAPIVNGNEETKATVDFSGSTINFMWEDGDVIGVVPLDDHTNQTNYTVHDTDGSSATCDGGSWAVKEGQYLAYYPYNNTAANSTSTLSGFSLVGQRQTENGSTSHLGGLNFMSATSECTTPGSVNFAFTTWVAKLRIRFDVPAGKYTRMELSTDEPLFAQSASLSLSDGTWTAGDFATSIALELEDVELASAGTLDMWITLAPCDQRNKNIRITVTDENGNTIVKDLKGMNMKSGNYYDYPNRLSEHVEFCQLPKGTEFNAAVLAAAGDKQNIRKISFETGRVVTDTANGYDITYDSETGVVTVSTSAEAFKLDNNPSEMFKGFNMMTTIKGFEKADASAAKDLYEMFRGCSSLESVDLSNFKPDYVWTIYSMFYNCSSLQSLDLSGFNKENTEEMENYYNMFYHCSSLTSLDLSSFDFSYAVDVDSMFEGCSSLESVSLGDMIQYTNSSMDMSSMFKGCINLESVDFSGWGTMFPYLMDQMFYDCRNLKTLLLPEINDRDLGSTDDMFYNLGISNYVPGGESASIPGTTICCSEHTYSIIRNELDDLLKYKFVLPEIIEPAELPAGPDFNAAIKAFETDGTPIRRIEFIVREDPSYLGGTKINSGFPGVYAQYSGGRLVLSTMAASYKSSADCSQMFAGLGNLEYVDRTENVDFSPATDMAHMFTYCSKLRGFWFPSCDYSHVTKMTGMFSDCTSLNSDEINLKELSTESVTIMESMFMNCGMSSYDLSSFNTANVQSMNKMFLAAANAESINFGNYFVIPSGCRVSYIIAGVANTSGKCWISCSDAVWNQLIASGTGYDPTKHFRTENYSVLPSDLKSIMNRRNTQRISFHANATAPNDGWSTAIELQGVSGCPVYYVTDNFGYEYDFYTTASEFRLPADASGYFNMSSVDPQIVSKLAAIEGLEYFNTSNVTNMSGMFEDAQHVQSLDLSSFDTSNVTDFSSFLAGCNSMQTVKFGDKFKISNGAVLTDFGAGLGSRNSAEEYNTIFYCPSTAWNTLLANWSICFYNGYNYCNKNASTDIGFDGGDNGGGNPITD